MVEVRAVVAAAELAGVVAAAVLAGVVAAAVLAGVVVVSPAITLAGIRASARASVREGEFIRFIFFPPFEAHGMSQGIDAPSEAQRSCLTGLSMARGGVEQRRSAVFGPKPKALTGVGIEERHIEAHTPVP